jgi:uncharacterized protein (TIGR02588 family)
VAGKGQEAKQKEQKGPSLLEWASAALGAILAIGTLVFIAIEAVDPAAEKPPLLYVQPLAVVAEGGLYVVELEVANRSGQTAAAVEIEGELKQAGNRIETSNATLNYVPGHSERRGGLIFTRDPRRYSFEVRATGFAKP